MYKLARWMEYVTCSCCISIPVGLESLELVPSHQDDPYYPRFVLLVVVVGLQLVTLMEYFSVFPLI